MPEAHQPAPGQYERARDPGLGLTGFVSVMVGIGVALLMMAASFCGGEVFYDGDATQTFRAAGFSALGPSEYFPCRSIAVCSLLSAYCFWLLLSYVPASRSSWTRFVDLRRLNGRWVTLVIVLLLAGALGVGLRWAFEPEAEDSLRNPGHLVRVVHLERWFMVAAMIPAAISWWLYVLIDGVGRRVGARLLPFARWLETDGASLEMKDRHGS